MSSDDTSGRTEPQHGPDRGAPDEPPSARRRAPGWLLRLRRLAVQAAAVFAAAMLLPPLLRRLRYRALLRRVRRAARPLSPRPPEARPSRVAAPDRVEPLFGRRATAVLLSVVTATVAVAAGGLAFALGWVRTPYAAGQYATVRQPVPFSHQLHVTGFEIDCRYCHVTVEKTATAGMPDTRTCVPCHNETWLEGPWFEPVRRSLATEQPIPWRRVNDLPDHVYFDHAIHVRRGMGCAPCHGDVAQMPIVYQTAPLTMQWCLDCHFDPEPWLRPIAGSTVRQAAGEPWPAGQEAPDSLDLAVARLTTCTACHR